VVAWQGLAMIGSVIAGFLLAQFYIRIVERITDIPSAIIMQFVGAFGVWILADEIGLSAIVTVVTFAITAARITPERTPASLRLPSYAVWETVVFVLNVMAFVAIGLQVRPILDSLEDDQRTHYLQIAGLVLATVVFVRIAWVFTYNGIAALKRRLFGPGSWPGEFVPRFAGMFIVSWCGMRGIVTLATAFALPDAFPFRDLILLCAFTVVAGTLVVQGLTLRPLIVLFGLKDDGTVEKEILSAQAQLARVAAEIIDKDDSDAAQMLRAEFAMPNEAEAAEGSVSERAKPRPRRGQRPLASGPCLSTIFLGRPAFRDLRAQELVLPDIRDRQTSLVFRESLPHHVAPAAFDHPGLNRSITLRLGAAKAFGKSGWR
jgi:NhaP-type Na+/H+ or K+/H+ antiporter